MILVTGASGIVGYEIASLFADKGENVIFQGFRNVSDGFIAVDLTDEDEVCKLFSAYDITTVIHAAAAIPAGAIKDHFDIYKANMQIAINLSRFCKKKTGFINISSTAIYNLQGSARLSENGDIKCDTLYQLSKKHSEELFLLNFGDSFLNIRISSPYSMTRENSSILYRFIKKAASGEPITLWGSGQRTQAFTNVHSLAKDLYFLYKQNTTGNYNYVTTNSITMLDLANEVAAVFNSGSVVLTGQEDPEEYCRTSISTDKISNMLQLTDTLNTDIAAMADRIKRA